MYVVLELGGKGGGGLDFYGKSFGYGQARSLLMDLHKLFFILFGILTEKVKIRLPGTFCLIILQQDRLSKI